MHIIGVCNKSCTVVILAMGFILFRFTKFGTYLKAIGAGEKAAMFSGIRTDRMKFWIYVLAGAITGFAAFINVIKVGSLLYIVLNSGLTMMGFTTQMMQLIQGVVFLIFVVVFADRESIQVIK